MTFHIKRLTLQHFSDLYSRHKSGTEGVNVTIFYILLYI